MKGFFLSLRLGAVLLASACTSEYQPPAEADGEAIFQAACAECHTPLSDKTPEIYFALHPKNFNAGYISHKVYRGGLTMPKFPHIKGAKMRQLTEYVLSHSQKR